MVEVPWLVACADGVELVVYARPRAKRSAVTGLHGSALAVRLAARPVEGAANRELIRVLAEALEVSRSAVTLLAGAKGRTKRVRVRGLTVAAVSTHLRSRLAIDKDAGRD